jgi:MFS transporter, YNFM family, putative membrane transport protein
MVSVFTKHQRQLLVLCLCIGMITFEGATTVGLLPVYAVQLGADPATTGAFLAFDFFTVALGTIVGGWLSDRIGHRKQMLLISCAIWIPAALLMTQATDILQLILTTGLMWFPGGIAVAIVNSLAGLSAAEGERGRFLGWTALAGGAGGLVAGLISGPIADRWSFPALFLVMAAVAGLMFVIAIFVQDKVAKRDPTQSGVRPAAQPAIGRLFYLVLLANLFARLGVFTSDLSRPLAMTGLGFDAASVSGAIAFSSAITLPLPLILGRLSDRFGRKRLLALCYGIGTIGILLLIPATAPWQFWLSASLAATINGTIGLAQAFVVDLVPPQAMGRGMGLYNTTTFLAGIVGLSGAGYVIQAFGISTTLLLGACLPLLAIGLVLRQPAPHIEEAAVS